MYRDINGILRAKVGLHIHTTRSDGNVSPEEALERYKKAGYDAVALTDHWVYNGFGEANGMTILSGGEYNVGGNIASKGVFHILGIGMESAPNVIHPDHAKDDMYENNLQYANDVIKAINEKNGYAVLAHPAWSLNTVEQIKQLSGIAATEIYNTVSEHGMSNRPYSGAIVDMLAMNDIIYPLIAVDDAHYYNGDECVAYIMVEAENNAAEVILENIKAGKFYSTQGPEVHIERKEDGSVRVVCSPCDKIIFMSDSVWDQERVLEGDGIQEGVYHPSGETFIRAEVVDREGRTGWSNIIKL